MPNIKELTEKLKITHTYLFEVFHVEGDVRVFVYSNKELSDNELKKHRKAIAKSRNIPINYVSKHILQGG